MQTIGKMTTKHLTRKGQMCPLKTAVADYVMTSFASPALLGFTPFELVFV